ncbi:A disintegrin and metalloproteinase with thrombospondin motifs 1-like [Aphidius gifuensis]|nr:A disintegrin and metalloproteinase with thrombospondin motifs 1-like [Aphidius gifuensis]
MFNSTWDIAITQTDLELCQPDSCNNASSSGRAFIGQTCNNDKSTESPIAIIYDANDFYGILVAAHETAHILGAVDDGQITIRNTSCTPDGSIMNPNTEHMYGPNSDTWSSCSVDEILTILKNKQYGCWLNNSLLDNQPSINIVPHILPGHMVSLSDQCKSRKFTDTCDESKTTCEVLYCWESSFPIPDFLRNCKDSGAPLGGTYCGAGKHCINQKCMPIDKNML